MLVGSVTHTHVASLVPTTFNLTGHQPRHRSYRTSRLSVRPSLRFGRAHVATRRSLARFSSLSTSNDVLNELTQVSSLFEFFRCEWETLNHP